MSHQVARAVQPMFGAPPIPTLAEVLVKLQQRDDLTPRQRADLCSAVRVLARAMGLPLEGTPARLDTLRLRLPRVLPAAHGFSRQRWNTLRSQFTAALRLAGVELLPGRFRSGLGQDWAPLYERLPGRTLRHSLSRVLHFFSVQGIAPGDVDEGAFVRFETALLETGPVDHPERIVRRTKVCWNQAGALVPGWPRHRLEVPNRRDWYSLPLTAFPAAFAVEVEAMLTRLGGLDPLQELPFRPVVASSLAKHRRQLRQLASALVHQGRDPASITSLRDLVAPEAARQALTFVRDRTGGKPTSQLMALSGLLLSVARHWVKVDAAQEDRLKLLARRCRPPRRGMTTKNRTMLRQLDDPDTLLRLLRLPGRLTEDLKREPRLSVRWAGQVMIALAVELLLVAPIRLRNLTNLDLERHLVRIGSGSTSSRHLWLPAEEVKNKIDLEFPLPRETVLLLEFYLAKARPVLAKGTTAGTSLFVGAKGGPPNQTALGTALTRLAAREAGVRISPHQFRHLAGYLYLRQYPGGYEVVRALLGHRSIATTIQFYAGMEGIAAARAYDAVVLKYRHGQP